MMIDGTYAVEVDTPLGRKSGTVTLTTNGNTLDAAFDMPVLGKQNAKATLDGDTFYAEGTFKAFLLGSIEYRVNGQVIGDDISATINTSKGDLVAVGVRIS